MADNLPAAAPSPASAIRCSPEQLAASIPGWVNLSDLAGIVPHGYGSPIPPGAAPAVQAAAEAHEVAIAPATTEERHSLLMGLRSATLIRDEHADEAEATMRLLVAHLADVPRDILAAACRMYCNAPGRRYFPRSAGELRTFINPLLHGRVATAWHLRRLAEQAEREEAERARLAADPLTPEARAEILAKHGLSARMAALIDR